ncbi:MAG: ParA family protein [Alphaproteobacteria bacterium]|nr:ParA family protein [Alphaproteobacteria bacterium]
MALLVGVVSQKGGVGKSTIARMVAREYAQAGWRIKIADLDISQGTSFNWQARRLQNKVTPDVPVERFGTLALAQKVASSYDLLVLDGPPHATEGTLAIAKASQLTILPTGLALDDLEPQVLLAHELTRRGVPAARLAFVLVRVGDSDVEQNDARAYLTRAGYSVLAGYLPEKVGYRRASDEGRAATETRFPSLNQRADELAQAVVDRVSTVTREEAA